LTLAEERFSLLETLERPTDFVEVFLEVIPIEDLDALRGCTHLAKQFPDPIVPITYTDQGVTQALSVHPVEQQGVVLECRSVVDPLYPSALVL
jgi:hypothetical protein